MITAITYLNSEVSTDKRGELRLYLDSKILDVVPRMGRTIVFKSTKVEHEVRPTKGYDRFAITTWCHAEPVVKITRNLKQNGTIFVGVPSYRDPLVVQTVLILIQNASLLDRVFIHVFLQHNLTN